MDRLTARQLRDRAGVSWRQLRDFRAAGVVGEPDESGRWSAEAVAALVRARELERVEGVRPLPRRVVRLRCEGFPVTGDKLRDAMRAIAPTVPQPVRTMRRLLRARRLLAEPTLAALPPREQARRERAAWQPPPPERWVDTLNRSNPEAVGWRFWQWCLAVQWARERTRGTPDDVMDIPLEEAVLLFAIQDIAAVLDTADKEPAGENEARPRRR